MIVGATTSAASAAGPWTDAPVTLSLDAPPATTTTTPTTAGPFDPFARGTWSFDAIGAGTWALDTGPIDFANGTVGAFYAATDGLQIGGELEADGLFNASPQDDGFGGGFNLRFRLRLFKAGDVTFFADLAAGALQTSVSVPDDGSHFNFRETGGLGAYVPLKDDLLLIAGVRAQHISNASLTHGDNPGYNGIQFYVGVTLPL